MKKLIFPVITALFVIGLTNCGKKKPVIVIDDVETAGYTNDRMKEFAGYMPERMDIIDIEEIEPIK